MYYKFVNKGFKEQVAKERLMKILDDLKKKNISIILSNDIIPIPTQIEGQVMQREIYNATLCVGMKTITKIQAMKEDAEKLLDAVEEFLTGYEIIVEL